MTTTIKDQEPIFMDAARQLEIWGSLGLFSAQLLAVSQTMGVNFYLKAASSSGQLAPGIYYDIRFGTPPPSTDDRVVIDLTNPLVEPEEINTYDELLYGLIPGEVMPEVPFEALNDSEREDLYGISPATDYDEESPYDWSSDETQATPWELDSDIETRFPPSEEGPIDLGFTGGETPEPLLNERDIDHLNAMLNEAQGQEAIWNMAYVENLAWRNEQNIIDNLGMFGDLEAERQGILEAAAAAWVLIPWETSGDDLVCEDCEELEAMGPYSPDEYPEPPHFGCRCMPGDPVLPEEPPPGFEPPAGFVERELFTEPGESPQPRFLEDYVIKAPVDVPPGENPLEMVQMAQVYMERWAGIESEEWKMEIFRAAGADLHDAAFNLALEWERVGKLLEAGEVLSAKDALIWDLRGMIMERPDIFEAAERLGLGVAEETAPEVVNLVEVMVNDINAAIEVPEGENPLEVVKVAQIYKDEWSGEGMSTLDRIIFDVASEDVHAAAFDLAEQFEELSGYTYEQLATEERAILDLNDLIITREDIEAAYGVAERTSTETLEYTVEDLANILKKVDDPRAFLESDEAAIFHNAAESEIAEARAWLKSEIEAISSSNRSETDLRFIKHLKDSGMNRPILVEDNTGQMWIIKTGTVEEAKNEIVGAEIAEMLGLGGPEEILTESLSWFQENVSEIAEQLYAQREDKNVVIFSKHVGVDATLAEYQALSNTRVIDLFWEFEDDAMTSIIKDILTLNTDGHFNNYMTDGYRLFTIDNSLADNNVSVYTKTAEGTPIVRSHFGEAMIRNSVENGELLGRNGMTAEDYVDYYFRDLIDKAKEIDVSSLPESRQAYIQDRIDNLEQLVVNEVKYWGNGGSWMNPTTH